MKTLFNKLMVTLMALTLVFGSTMTAFAAEDETKTPGRVEGEDVVAGEQEIPVNVTYTKNIDTDNGGTDDSLKKIYCIEILYDELDFSYEATKIEWIPDACIYKVTTNSSDNMSPRTKNIEVINKSNRALNMTTDVKRPDPPYNPLDYRELEYLKMDLTINNITDPTHFNCQDNLNKVWSGQDTEFKNTIQLGWGVDNDFGSPLVESATANVKVAVLGFDSSYYAKSINTFEKLQVANISLSFEDPEPAEETGTD